MTMRLQGLVRLSAAFSCGCTQGKSEPIRALDADTLPGGVVICERCQEYAVVTRVSVYLADVGAKTLERLLREEGDVDPGTAAQIAAEQSRPRVAQEDRAVPIGESGGIDFIPSGPAERIEGLPTAIFEVDLRTGRVRAVGGPGEVSADPR